MELGLWVRKQRAAKEQGSLSEERLRILLEMGFEFGEEANVTEEWELRFDLLMELLFMRVSPSSLLAQLIGHDQLMPTPLMHSRRESRSEHRLISRRSQRSSLLAQPLSHCGCGYD